MIKITNLNKNFNNRILFNDFNLELDSNKLIFITGPSGSGKTTLLNMIGNIVLPDSGKITYLEKDKEYSLINNKNNVKIGIVFQAFNLLNNLSAFDNLSIAQQINGREIEKHKINSPLENFDLDKEKKILAKNLSSGQQQRLAFLRSLVLENDILLADEPTGNLDSENKHLVMKELKEISKDKTVIVVSHDLELAMKYAEQIIYLEEGKISKIEHLDQNQNHNENDSINFSKAIKKSLIKHKFLALPKLMVNDLRKNKLNLLLFLISLIFSLLFLFFTFLLNSANDSLTLRTNVFLENDKIFISKKDNNFFNKEEVKQIIDHSKENEKINKVLSINSLANKDLVLEYGDGHYSINQPENEFEQIEFNDFLKKELDEI